MKKIIATLVAAAMVSAAAFADDVKLSFYNKLYEEDPILEHSDAADETSKDFPAINERMQVKVTSEKVDALVKATMALDDYDDEHFGLQGKVNAWWIEFRPLDIVAIDLRKNTYADGSYLPIYDDNVAAGNIGSKGLTVIAKPVEGLRVGVTAPFPAFITGTDDVNYLDNGDVQKFNVGLGAIYDHELFQAGVSVQDVADSDERQIGAYVNLPKFLGKVEPLTVGLGFAHSENWQETFDDVLIISEKNITVVKYQNLLNAYATFEAEKFSVSAETLYNLSDDEISAYDLYAAASVSFGIVENLTATVTGKILADLKDKGDTAESITQGSVALDYDVNDNNTVGAEFDVALCDKDWSIAVPVYWKYYF